MLDFLDGPAFSAVQLRKALANGSHKLDLAGDLLQGRVFRQPMNQIDDDLFVAHDRECGSGIDLGQARLAAQSVFGNCLLGSTGHWPVPSGDSPDGTGGASPANEGGRLLGSALLVPVGGSPTGTGGSPVLPIFQTRSQASFALNAAKL